MIDETIEEFLARGGKIKKLPPGRASADDAIDDELPDVFMLQHPSDDVKLSDEEFEDLRNRRKFRMDLPVRRRSLGYDELFGTEHGVPFEHPDRPRSPNEFSDDTEYAGIYGRWVSAGGLPDMDGKRRGRGSL